LTPGRPIRGHRRLAVTLSCLVGLACLGALLWAVYPRDGLDAGGAHPGQPAPLRLKNLRVMHYAADGEVFRPAGQIGEQSMATRFGDRVTLTVELSEPAWFYIVALNFDGTVELQWPADEENEPVPGQAPPRLERLHFPRGDDVMLSLEEKGSRSGVQGYVVAASRQALPAFAEWSRRVELSWRALPAGRTVWWADATGCYPVVSGVGPDRSPVRKTPGKPPLREVCEALLGGGMEVAEAIAFPVLPREEAR
jgi:hypothetical protein